MGITYVKSVEFFDSETFDLLVDYIVESEKEGNILGDVYEEEKVEEMNEECSKRQKTLVDKEIEPEKKQFWKEKLINFLTGSNEKWILDQFNLCKRFFLQNSIEGMYKDFEHPFYNRFSHIRALRIKVERRVIATAKSNARNMNYLNMENVTKLMDNSLIVDCLDEDRNQSLEKKDKEIGLNAFGKGNTSILEENFQKGLEMEKVMKCDISALLKAIEEIEKRLRMEKILYKVINFRFSFHLVLINCSYLSFRLKMRMLKRKILMK